MDAELRALLRQTVTIEPYAGDDDFGAPTYGAPVVYAPDSPRGGARVASEIRMVRAPDGQERVSRTVVWLDGSASVGVRDRITLPDGSRPPILAVEAAPDETGENYGTKLRLE